VALGAMGGMIIAIPLIVHSKVRLFALSPTVSGRVNFRKRIGE
jgi:hypothetical protein